MTLRGIHLCLTLTAAAVSLACDTRDETLFPFEHTEEADSNDREIEMSWEENKSAEQLAEMSALQGALTAARDRWGRFGATSYTAKVRRQCFCAPTPEDDVRVTVTNGRVTEARGLSAEGRYEVPVSPDAQRDWYTVSGMFDVVASNLTADKVVAEYDEAAGFPTFLLLDYHLISSEEGDIFEMWDLVNTATQ